MTKPTVSIIVPIFNAEHYLKDCAYSILNQTFENFELLLIDDCSTDESLEIAMNLEKQDRRIRLYKLSSNSGPSTARNIGIDQSTGEYIIFVDSDDWIENKFIETLVTSSKKHRSDIAVGKASFIRNRGEIKHLSNQKEVVNYNSSGDKILNREDALINLFTSQSGIRHAPWGKLYKRELFEPNVRYPVGLLLEDHLTTYKLVDKADIVSISQSANYYYYLSPKSLTRGKFKKNSLDALPLVFEIKNHLSDPNGSLKEALEYSEYEATHFIINSMIKGDGDRLVFRALMQQLTERIGKLSRNRYMSIKDIFLLQLMRAPLFYESILRAVN